MRKVNQSYLIRRRRDICLATFGAKDAAVDETMRFIVSADTMEIQFNAKHRDCVETREA